MPIKCVDMATTSARRHITTFLSLLLKVTLVHRAKWTYPIGGQVFEFGSGGDAVVWVANCGIIHISANVANVFLHCLLLI